MVFVLSYLRKLTPNILSSKFTNAPNITDRPNENWEHNLFSLMIMMLMRFLRGAVCTVHIRQTDMQLQVWVLWSFAKRCTGFCIVLAGCNVFPRFMHSMFIFSQKICHILIDDLLEILLALNQFFRYSLLIFNFFLIILVIFWQITNQPAGRPTRR